MGQLPDVEARVYFVIYPSNTMGQLLCAIHTKEDKLLAENEAVQIGRIQYGDCEIFIYSPIVLTSAEAEQLGEHAIRMATGQKGGEFIPQYVEVATED